MAGYILRNGQVVSSEGVIEADVLIENGKIKKVMKWGGKEPIGVKEIDCKGKMIFPGFIDVHVHFREPGAEYKEDWITGSSAAVSSGVTTVCDMPNTPVPTVSARALEEKRALVGGRSYVNYGFYFGYNGKNIDEINGCENVAGVKVYVANSTGDMGVGTANLEDLFRGTDKRIVLHCEDEAMIKKRMEYVLKEFKGREDEISPSIHSEIRSPECAFSSVRYVCELVKKCKRPVHIAHLSTEEELNLVCEYRKYGVTCEVAPHHLLLSDDDYEDLGNLIKVNPPVRSRADLFALWKGLKAGDVDIIATDHAPHTLDEKDQRYLDAPAGIPEEDTLGAWLLNTINDEGFSFEEVARFCCERPAELFGMKGKGHVKEGYDADIVVADMDLKKKVEAKDLFTKCSWSPYEDFTFEGWPVMTFVGGEMVFESGKVKGKPRGKEVNFE